MVLLGWVGAWLLAGGVGGLSAGQGAATGKKRKVPKTLLGCFGFLVFLFCFGWVGAWLLGGGVGGLPAGQGVAAGKKRKWPKKLLGSLGLLCACVLFRLCQRLAARHPRGGADINKGHMV